MIPQLVTYRQRRRDGRWLRRTSLRGTGQLLWALPGTRFEIEQGRQVLEMLAEGKITADEAERLIDALEREQIESPPAAALPPKPDPSACAWWWSRRTTPTVSGLGAGEP